MTWIVDLDAHLATHSPSGFKMAFRASRGQITELTPIVKGTSLGPVEIVRLIREGKDEIERLYEEKTNHTEITVLA